MSNFIQSLNTYTNNNNKNTRNTSFLNNNNIENILLNKFASTTTANYTTLNPNFENNYNNTYNSKLDNNYLNTNKKRAGYYNQGYKKTDQSQSDSSNSFIRQVIN